MNNFYKQAKMEKRNIIVPLEGGEKVHWQILKRFEFEYICRYEKKNQQNARRAKKNQTNNLKIF